jgi:hypothetical protein
MRTHTRTHTYAHMCVRPPTCLCAPSFPAQAEGGALPTTLGPNGEVIVEKVVQVPKALDAAFLDQMRKDMEEQMKAEMATKQHKPLTDEQMAKVGRGRWARCCCSSCHYVCGGEGGREKEGG